MLQVVAVLDEVAGQPVEQFRAPGAAIHLVGHGDEPAPPYQPPPLSKAYLKGELEAERLFLKPIEYYAEHGVELVTGNAAKAIDLAGKRVVTVEEMERKIRAAADARDHPQVRSHVRVGGAENAAMIAPHAVITVGTPCASCGAALLIA